MAMENMAGMRPGLTVAVMGMLVLPLGACGGSVAETLGMGKRSPDEFAVVRRQPLIVPPDFDLRPPRPGAERPVGERPSELAYSTLTGQAAGSTAGSAATGPGGATEPPRSATTSPGQSALLAEVGRVSTDPDIREELAAEAGTASVDRALFTRIMQEQPADTGAGQSPSVVRHEQRALDDLAEESF